MALGFLIYGTSPAAIITIGAAESLPLINADLPVNKSLEFFAAPILEVKLIYWFEPTEMFLVLEKFSILGTPYLADIMVAYLPGVATLENGSLKEEDWAGICVGTIPPWMKRDYWILCISLW